MVLMGFSLLITLLLSAAGGFISVRWSGAARKGRCAVLGGLSGALTGTIVFCLWGAASAGSTRQMTFSPTDQIPMIVNQTVDTFFYLFISSGLAGMLGGWLASFRRKPMEEVFDMEEPQMAMNASITALPASIVAAGVAAAVFPRLGILVRAAAGIPFAGSSSIVDKPLEAALFLVLVSHLAVTLVVPHETRQSQHLCGMNEVKMAAFVGIGAAPLLAILLLAVYPAAYSNLLVLTAVCFSTVMSLISVYFLVKRVFPKIEAFPPYADERQKKEAILFGSIAGSIASRLVMLCIGCGLMMVLPLYISVISVLINLNSIAGPLMPVGLQLAQALASTGLMAAASAVLILIYMVYLNLGRWFSRR